METIKYLKVGDKVDYQVTHGDWLQGYATIIYFHKDDGLPVCEMNYPGHDGCRWAHKYSFESIRKSSEHLKQSGL